MNRWQAALVALLGATLLASVIVLLEARDHLRRVSQDLHRTEVIARRAAKSVRAQASEVAELEGRLAAEKRRSSRLLTELDRADTTINRACSFPQDRVDHVRVLSPSPGSAVTRPVLLHLRPVDPPFCTPTYMVTVDGFPYAFLGRLCSDGFLGNDAEHPSCSRRLPRRPHGLPPCISTGNFFATLRLRPGRHVLRVTDACPQGTAVPRVRNVRVDFVVSR